jgi:hypothetical protein
MIRLLFLMITLIFATSTASAQALRLGTTTHFSQGWPITLLDKAKRIGVTSIRDSLHWPVIEKTRGQYDLSDGKTRHIRLACAAGMTVLLTIEPRNPLYDGGTTAYSAEGRTAYANYVLAIADRFKGCVTAIEVGNEINGRNGITGPAAQDRIASHLALLRSVYGRVKPTHSELQLLGGSTNAIGTGFLAKLFEAGALSAMDGVVVHPYRRKPEGVEWEIARLVSAMQRTGEIKPIWATEFSRDFVKPDDAAPFYLKMLCLMTAAGVDNTYWYALVDEKWFPTMGLLTTPGGAKPASRSFSYAASQLAPMGRANRIGTDPTLYHFRFGRERSIIWGGRRAMKVTGNAVFRRADGTIVLGPTEVNEDPIIVEGPAIISFGPAEVLADSLYGFGQEPLSYFARNTKGAIAPIVPIDWIWGSYLGAPGNGAMIVNQQSIGPTGTSKAGLAAVVRFTSSSTSSAIASLCLSPKVLKGVGVMASISHNDKIVWQGIISQATGKQLGQATIPLKPGDSIDFAVNPGNSLGPARMDYRYRVSRTAKDVATC